MDRTRSFTEARKAALCRETGGHTQLTGMIHEQTDSEHIPTPASFLLADTGICAAVVALFLAPLIAIALY